MKKFTLCMTFIAMYLNIARAQVTPTNEWVSFWSDSSRINNTPLHVGAVVKAFDPQGVLCGQFTVTVAGQYGMMPVYRDDPTTPTIDEGAQPGDTIHFTIDDMTAVPSGPTVPVWTSNGAVEKVNLVVREPEIQLSTTAIVFGSVPLKGSATRSLTITNTGLKPLKVDSIKLLYHFPNHFTLSESSTTLNPGGSTSINITFSPALGSGDIGCPMLIYSNSWYNPVYSISVLAHIQTDVASTNEWVSFWGDAVTLDGRSVTPGDVIDAYDPQGVHCGTFTVTAGGQYGVMPVYRDDATTSTTDEGASPGDSIVFTVNGFHATPKGPDRPLWTANGSVFKVNLEGTTLLPPLLVSPAKGLKGVAAKPTLSWSTSVGATGYRLQVSIDSLFASLVKDTSGVASTSLVLTGLANLSRYYWRVNCSNAGGTSDWSTVWNFTTTVTAPKLAFPPSDAKDQPVKLVLKVYPVTGASGYSWQVSMNPLFSSSVLNDSTAGTGDTAHAVTLAPSTKYYWHVRAFDADGAGEFSAADSFTTMATAAAPKLFFPASNAANVRADTLVFKWHPSLTATKYVFHLSKNAGFSTYAANDSNVVDTTYKIVSLDNFAKYYWRVCAYNVGGFGPFAADSFTTIVAPPSVPVLISPVSKTGVPRKTTFIWHRSPFASKYRLQVAKDNAFSVIIVDTTLTDPDSTKKLSSPLDVKTEYYWRVNASDTGGTSPYSSSANFTTGIGIDIVGEPGGIPREFSLRQNYPNPFNPTTTISYELPERSRVSITVFDVLGRDVRTLVDEEQAAGVYQIILDASSLPSGVYFYRIAAGRFVQTKKLVVVK